MRSSTVFAKRRVLSLSAYLIHFRRSSGLTHLRMSLVSAGEMYSVMTESWLNSESFTKRCKIVYDSLLGTRTDHTVDMIVIVDAIVPLLLSLGSDHVNCKPSPLAVVGSPKLFEKLQHESIDSQ